MDQKCSCPFSEMADARHGTGGLAVAFFALLVLTLWVGQEARGRWDSPTSNPDLGGAAQSLGLVPSNLLQGIGLLT